jgi:hypothetical protein
MPCGVSSPHWRPRLHAATAYQWRDAYKCAANREFDLCATRLEVLWNQWRDWCERRVLFGQPSPVEVR